MDFQDCMDDIGQAPGSVGDDENDAEDEEERAEEVAGKTGGGGAQLALW